VIPEWVLDLIEKYISLQNPVGKYKKHDMFKSMAKKKVVHDKERKLVNCGLDWILYFLIAVPVTLALARHGFLVIIGGLVRIAKVVTYIESFGGGDPKEERDQSWHTDFAGYLSEHFGDQFGISVLVGGSEGSEVHIIDGTFGGEDNDTLQDMVNKGHLKKIVLERGELLIMGPGLRHKGIGYLKRNVRLFLAFLGGRSVGASFFDTYSLDDVVDEKNICDYFAKVLNTGK